MVEEGFDNREDIIKEITILQNHLSKYLDLKSPFKSQEDTNDITNISRYKKLSITSLNLILKSLKEQLKFYIEAEVNPLNIKKPKEIPPNLFFDIFLNTNQAVIIENDREVIILVNQKACNLFGYKAEEFLKLRPSDLQHITKEKHIVPIYNDEKFNRFSSFETYFKHKSGTIFPGEIQLIKLEYNNSNFFIAMISDISIRKKEEEIQNKLIKDLQKALENIKQLKGLIPICGMCKKIRNDGGYWNQLDNYIQEITDITYSHELCPDCQKKNWHLIISYFNSFYGPLVLINGPQGELNAFLNDVAMLLDLQRYGFFEMSMGNAKTLNLQYELPSQVSRGDYVSVMISFAVIDGELNHEVAQAVIESLLEKILLVPNLDLVFSHQHQKTPEAQEAFDQLSNIFYQEYYSIEEKVKHIIES